MKSSFIRYLRYIVYFFKEVFLLDSVRINSTAELDWLCRIRPNNWGDDLNLFFLKEISVRKISYYPTSLLSRFLGLKNYICIGSTIETRSNKNAVIWGAGLIRKDGVPQKPHKIYAVRGPLTRKRLLELNINCPPVYGDPALLLPSYYQPKNIAKKYKIGFIPHYVDQNNEILNSLLFQGGEDVTFIDLKKYHDWKQIINAICSCEFIVSSSLHGIIASDAYGIPNIWVKFSDKVTGNGFKFQDYFASVKRDISEPIQMTDKVSLDDLFSMKEKYVKPIIKIQSLIESCPFKLKKVKYEHN